MMHLRQTSLESAPSGHLRGGRQPANLSVPAEPGLCAGWCDRNDISAAEQMIRGQRGLVLQTARAYSGCGLPWDELIGEAHTGLMRAACRFDPDGELSFAGTSVGGSRRLFST